MTKLTPLLFVPALAALFFLSSCCCGGEPGPTCTAKLKYTGGEYSKKSPFIADGTSSTREAAIERACKDYCYSADETYDEKFTEWVKKPENKSVRERWEKDPRHEKEWGIITNDSMKRELELCTDRCAENVRKKKEGFSATINCEAPPED